MITQMPLDMKVEKGEPEKLESHSTSGTPGPADFPSRPSGAPAALAPRGQSSPHVLASPHHDRSTDSPQVMQRPQYWGFTHLLILRSHGPVIPVLT